ncbi:hypothetical protein Hanom_Chr03g00274141 [Helianthus anomalus]
MINRTNSVFFKFRGWSNCFFLHSESPFLSSFRLGLGFGARKAFHHSSVSSNRSIVDKITNLNDALNLFDEIC